VSLTRFHVTALTGWFGAIAVLLVIRFALGPPTSLAEGLGLLLLGALPAAIFLAIFRGAPPPTVAEVLYDTEHAARSNRTAR
jgi:hypothetical protein